MKHAVSLMKVNRLRLNREGSVDDRRSPSGRVCVSIHVGVKRLTCTVSVLGLFAGSGSTLFTSGNGMHVCLTLKIHKNYAYEMH